MCQSSGQVDKEMCEKRDTDEKKTNETPRLWDLLISSLGNAALNGSASAC